MAPVAEGPSALDTVYRWFAAWRDACLFEKINHALVMTDSERVGREASPLAAIIDKRRASKPRRLAARAVMMPARRSTGANVMRWLTRTAVGLLIEPHPAGVQNSDGGRPLLQASRCFLSFHRAGLC